ncbi:MAG: hypothetical protein ACHRHE_02405 [Tepidisphaerales bacterium]
MKSFKEWLGEGEQIYAQTMSEYEELETQLADLQQRLAQKKAEVNEIASVIGKPAVSRPEPARVERVSGAATPQFMDRDTPGSVPASRQTIAKVLAGKSIG